MVLYIYIYVYFINKTVILATLGAKLNVQRRFKKERSFRTYANFSKNLTLCIHTK